MTAAVDKAMGAVRSGPKPFLTNMQVLRFIAAVMVLISHLDREARLDGLKGPVAGVMDALSVNWSCGVDIFFGISGFLMLFLSWDKFGKAGYAGEFLKRRFIRVAPLYWLFTLIFTAIALGQPHMVMHGDISGARLATSLLFLPFKRASGDVYPVLALGWTLNYEILFYVLFALALGLRRSWALAVLVGGFLTASLINPVVDPTWVPVKFWTNPIILEFILGMLVCWLYIQGVRLSFWVRVALAFTGLVILIAMSKLGLADTVSHVGRLPRSVWAGLPCILIVSGFMLGPQMAVSSRFQRWLVLGGDASYSLYLTHMFATRAATLACHALHVENSAVFFVVGLVAAITLAVIVFLYIESPILAFFRKHFEPMRGVVSA